MVNLSQQQGWPELAKPRAQWYRFASILKNSTKASVRHFILVWALGEMKSLWCNGNGKTFHWNYFCWYSKSIKRKKVAQIKAFMRFNWVWEWWPWWRRFMMVLNDDDDGIESILFYAVYTFDIWMVERIFECLVKNVGCIIIIKYLK